MPEARQRIGPTPERLQGQTSVVVGGRGARVDFERGIDEFDCACGTTRTGGDDPAQMQCIEVHGLLRGHEAATIDVSHQRNEDPTRSDNMNPATLRRQLREALAHHRAGLLPQAKAVYDDILRAHPGHYEALHLSGVLAAQSGNPAEALSFIDRALQIDASNPVDHFNRGTSLQDLECWLESIDAYRRAVAAKPNYPEANLNLGSVLAKLHRWDEALTCFDAAIACQPRHAAAHLGRAHALRKLFRLDAALAAYDRVIAQQPGSAEAHYHRALVQQQLRRWRPALEGYELAIALQPGHAAALCNRGLMLKQLNDFDASLASFDAALRLEPALAEAHSARGSLLQDLGRLTEALACYEAAIAYKTGFVEAHVNLANLHREMADCDAAVASCDAAIAFEPANASAHLHRALAWLLSGDYARGWTEYEWRFRYIEQVTASPLRPPLQPPWRGEPLVGRRILLHAEQGLGDTLQFCRYAALVAELGAVVMLQVQRPLRRLLQRLPGVAEVVITGEPLPKCDFQVPFMSLPLAFGTRLDNIPGRPFYIAADPELIAVWEQRVGKRTRPRVGLVWSGGFRDDQPEVRFANARRNISLELLGPLASPDIEFFSLQKGLEAEAQLARLLAAGWHGPYLRDFTAQLDDFADTAALIAQLDLIISVDTSTAHLAAAMGKPVWLLNRFDTCWRWLLQRRDSPWYPSLRVYRQERPGDWEGVVSEVHDDLRAFVRDA